MEKSSGISEIEKILTQFKEGKKEKECLQVGDALCSVFVLSLLCAVLNQTVY